MMEALGYGVLGLHRKEFMGITLEGLDGEGYWNYLEKSEMDIVKSVLQRAEREEEEEII